MMRALVIVSILALVVLVSIPIVWLGSAVIYQNAHTYTHRFRLGIEVDTPNGVVSNSSVIEVTKIEKADWTPTLPGVVSRVHGEAVFFDLGEGRNVIAILGFGPTGSEDRIASLTHIAFLPGRPKLQIEDIPKLTGSVELTGNLIPTLVTFENLNDPATARVVRSEEVEQVFGPGFRFRRAWIEMTSDSVTRGIEQKLPMLTIHREWIWRLYSEPTKFTPHYHLFTRS